MSNPDLSTCILIVDDDEDVRTLLRECLEFEWFTTAEASTGSDAVSILNKQQIGLITLDLNLGGESGFDVARDIRATNNVPIVMITGRGDTIDRVVGLELGADDYIAKPFQLREVVARIRAVLRRYQSLEAVASPAAPESGGKDQRFAFGEFTLSIPRRQLVKDDGDEIELTTAEFNMLVMFLERPNRVLSRDNIMDILKGNDWSPVDRSIDALVVRLRRRIEADNKTPKYIKTVRGVGYVFAGEIRKR